MLSPTLRESLKRTIDDKTPFRMDTFAKWLLVGLSARVVCCDDAILRYCGSVVIVVVVERLEYETDLCPVESAAASEHARALIVHVIMAAMSAII